MNIVAHEDDDILFLSPDLIQEIAAGRCIRTVFVTAGDANNGTAYWQGREAGAQAAYEKMTGSSSSWISSDAGVPGHDVKVQTLAGSPKISLIFLRLPDGNMDGSGFSNNHDQSLQKLWLGAISSADSVDGSNSYTNADLQNTLLTLVNNYQPDHLKTQNHVGSYGDGDHSDHHTVAYLVDNVNQQYTAAHVFLGYQDYVIASFEANVLGADRTTKQSAFVAYAAHDASVSLTGDYAAWVQRQYKAEAGPNLALRATASASTQDTATAQTASKAIDGSPQGYPGDYTREWATVSGVAGSWLKLSWATPQTVEQIVLNDRPNTTDQITAGTLTFSDGSTVAIGSLNNDGSDTRVTFNKKTITSVQLNVTSVSASTVNVGLAEIKVYGPPQLGTNHALTARVTASSQNAGTSQTATKAIDGVVAGYPGDSTKEWATMGGKANSWLLLSWGTPRTINQIVLHDRPNLIDQVTAGVLSFSDGTQVAVGVLNNDSAQTPLVFPRRTVTWVKFQASAVSASTVNVGLAELEVYGP